MGGSFELVSFPFTGDRAAELGADPARASAARAAVETGLPDTSAEVWRYSPVAELDLDGLRPVTAAPEHPIPAPAHYDEEVAGITVAATVTVVDGFVTSIDVADGWRAKGLNISAEPVSVPALEEPPNFFDHLYTAFAPDGVCIEISPDLVVTDPILIRSHLTADAAGFIGLQVRLGSDSEATVFEYQTSEGGGLAVPMTVFDLGAGAHLRHTYLQDLQHTSWQVGRMISNVAEHATLSSGLLAFGGRYGRLRTDTSLNGRGAKGELIGAYFCDGNQILDYRTFQQHAAPDTISDLLFKGTVDDEAGSVYTGMIHIHPEGAGSNAFQTNRNVKLGEDAWAWSVPNLEIENNDVRCSHASTVSPVDPDQRFYLHSRGVPPTIADRLIVAGFFEEALRRMPVVPAARIARALISDKLDHRLASR